MDSKNHNDYKMIFEIAGWEFHRWFKIKEQIITLVIGAILSLLIFGGKSFIDKYSDREIKIVVINGSIMPIKFSQGSNIKLIQKEIKNIEAQKQLLIDKKIDGILIIKDSDNADIIVNNESGWLNELREALTAARQKIKLAQSNISPSLLQNIFKPIEMKLLFTDVMKQRSSSSEKIAAGTFIVLMLVGIFLGLAYQFVAITGEKQLRITETIISAVSAQTWIDGKILGISMLSLVLLGTYSISTLLFVWISSLFGSGWALPISITNPALILLLFAFALAGFFFWNTFFSAIAATINDPNTSARGSLIMVPCIPIAIAFFALGNPDSLAMKILSLFPITSAPVISARLVLTDVSFIEVFLSLLLLVLTTLYLRRAAGRIFSLSILLYGKEPTWKEISKWLKHSK